MQKAKGSFFFLAVSVVLVSCLVLLLGVTAHAQTYPTKPIRLVIPFSAGGVSDTMTRLVAQKLSERLGQPCVPDNRPGAGGIIAAETVAKAAPDGYTLFIGEIGPNAINPSIYKKLPYDPRKDFVPMVHMVNIPAVLVASLNSKVTSGKEMIRAAQAAPGKMTYSSAGIGHITHVLFEAIKVYTGINVIHVPYKGGMPAVTDVVANVIDFNITSVSTAGQFVAQGKVRALAETSAKRISRFPDVPTFFEAGLINFPSADGWNGFFAPAGTPQAIVTKINQEVNAVLKSKEVADKIRGLGAEPVGGSADELGRLVVSQIELWAKIAKQANIPLQ